jgi:hypothetical protein
LSRKVKGLIYEALIRPVLTYGSETWDVGKQGENIRKSFERKVLRKIFGPVVESGCRRRGKSPEIYKLCDERDVVKFVKRCRLRWVGHVMRMGGSDAARKIFWLNWEELEIEKQADQR